MHSAGCIPLPDRDLLSGSEAIALGGEGSRLLPQKHDARDAFVVLADGEPNDVFPRALTHVLNKSTGEYQEIEPLAMDVRADSIAGSLKKAKTHIRKLYAGMLGCSYDSLVQREKTRKRKWLIALAAVLQACCL